MMHSHDRTLLASLGFKDPDKANPEHDQACLFLSQPDTLTKLSEWLKERINKDPKKQCNRVTTTATIEHHLQKGTGQYRTTVGFLDAMFKVTATTDPPSIPWTWPVIGEVKINREGIGNILRQMNLYRSYLHGDDGRGNLHYGGPVGIVFAPWDMTTPEEAALEDAGYAFVKLGDQFQAWLNSKAA